MRISPEAAALLFINRFYPQAEAAILAGSVIRNDATDHSDLDIVIIDETNDGVSRSCHEEYGWPIEVFLYTKNRFYPMFESDCMIGVPFLPRMCAEGVILKDKSGLAKEIKEESRKRMEEGPIAWSEGQVDHFRYTITDLLDDLIGSNNRKEDLFTAGKLAEVLHEFVLRANRQWVGYGKWVLRSLEQYDPVLAERFADAFDEFYKTRQKQKVEHLVDEVLEPFGGRLFNGYRS